METTTPPTAHIGKKISRIRELRGMKQEVLAAELGISQQAVSKIEQSAEVEEGALEKIAKVLGVTVEAVKNFNEEAVINYFNTFNDNSTNNGAVYAFNSTFNPIDKIVELYNEKVELLERLLQSEREKNDLLRGK
ncbi:MAG: helix-turn-helix transcriptional regulator [Daejeonella sp.]|uniref:helix-turn-helix domain-containing protein n=1 Tax=Daejeonella sp. TaxID=2805397 RepID=UPI0027333E4A|nr:helix-turn-helix transcriptional regulator [Daejeonella sp.]MDP3469607.1 helix-turn-helix transcriptional regulator [Daejeonella sp.]